MQVAGTSDPRPHAGGRPPQIPPAVPAPTPPAPAAPAAPPAERIRQLKKLLDEGLISPQEFEAKRQRLLEEV
jgi:hypothetical protein